MLPFLYMVGNRQRRAHTLMVSLPEILRREDARTGHAAKNAQIVDKYQLVGADLFEHAARVRTDAAAHESGNSSCYCKSAVQLYPDLREIRR